MRLPKPRGPRSRPPRGFTLVEVLTSLAIFAILSVLAVGGLEPMITTLQVRTAAARGAEALVRARSEAKAVGRCYAVDVVNGATLATSVPAGFEMTGTALRLSRWASADCEHSTTVVAEELVTMPSYAQIRFGMGSTAPLVWRPNGRLQGASTTLELLSDGVHPQVSVVVAQPGPVCTFPSSSIGSCP